jgi:hypothetical protein
MDETRYLPSPEPLFLAKFTEALFAEEKFRSERNICKKYMGFTLK